MEKFSNWRDKGTGISPFIPTTYPKHSFLSLPLSIVLFLIKLPFLLLTFPLVLLDVKPVKEFSLKFLFNFRFNQPSGLLLPNDFVVVNYSSPLLVYLLSDVVIIPNSDGILYQLTKFQLLLHSLGLLSTDKGKVIDDMSKLSKKIIFCLAEGTPTNNKCVLKFLNLDPKYLLEGFNFKTFVVKISPNYFNVPLPSSAIGFFYQLLINSPSLITLKLVSHQRVDWELSKTAFRNSNLHSVNLSVTDKVDFYKYYLQNI